MGGHARTPALIFMFSLMLPAMGASGVPCLFQESVETAEVDGGLSWSEPSACALCLVG